MNWRIRLNITSPSFKGNQYRKQTLFTSFEKNDSSWNTSKIHYQLNNIFPTTRNIRSNMETMIVHRHSNVKRCLSKDSLSTIKIDKKLKISQESPTFVLACGQNICGQLGLSTNIIERRKPQHIKIINELKVDEQIQSVYAGSMHSCALTRTGQVYTWGCNDDAALGRITNDIDDENIPQLCTLPEEIESLHAGDSFTVAISKSGHAYISGCFRSSEGLLGLFEYRQIAQQPIVVPVNQAITHAACGADFCLLLTNDGDLYSFGNNETGQLGRDAHINLEENYSSWLRPSPISFFKGQRILKIWAGGHGFFVLTQSSTIRLFSCGANSFGQLGHSLKQPVYTPLEIQNFPSIDKILKITCGLHHTLILDIMGNVFGLGRSDDGRLGNNHIEDVIYPKQIDQLRNIIDIAAGGSVSFAIDNVRQIYSFGMGNTCQTGHGDSDILIPTIIIGKQLEKRIIQQISVGAQHTLFLVKEI